MAWVDARQGQLVTVDGYVYAPYFGKREYLREVEAMVRSFAPLDSPNPLHTMKYTIHYTLRADGPEGEIIEPPSRKSHSHLKPGR